MPPKSCQLEFRVRYSETDQMGTYYNSRVLEWFECGRTELIRVLGKPYAQWERQGVRLPLIEAHVEYLGKAGYDDLLRMTTTVRLAGKARLRFDVAIEHAADSQPVCRGYTVHAIVGRDGRPIRPPGWLCHLLEERP